MKNTWYKLDNVGTFYASLTNKRIPGVFRFTATMIEDVDKDILLAALKKTISLLPNINVSLKAGFFWYYLEQSNEEVEVLEDNGNVCSRIYTSKYPRLFRVTYYKKRINLELSHVLSDGRGTLEIFKVLINSYIALKYNIEINVNETSSSLLEKVEDSFDKYYKKGKKAKNNNKNIYRYNKIKLTNNRINFYEVHLNSKKLLEIAHKYNATITSFLISVIIYCIKEEMKERELSKNIKIDIPVDLRTIYKSSTLKNFFALSTITYKVPSKDTKIEDIIKYVKKYLKENLTEEQLSPRVNKMEGFEKLIAARLLPLIIKEIGINVIDFFTKKLNTTIISNVGIVTFPKECEKYIDNISCLSTTENFQFTAITYKDNLCIGISSRYYHNNIIKNLIRYLKSLDLELLVNTNEV